MREAIIEKLKTVYDPELGLNVYDLGLIYKIEIDDGNVDIEMTLTTPGCPLHSSITQGVENAVYSVPGVKNVHVELVWEPAWSPDRITEEGREQLNSRY
jgi:FeS assembly SUF system protein